MALCLLEERLARAHIKNLLVGELGRISVVLSDELENKLRLKTLEVFGGRKGDLSRAVEEAVKTWVATEK